jgi:hypothetical protein
MQRVVALPSISPFKSEARQSQKTSTTSKHLAGQAWACTEYGQSTNTEWYRISTCPTSYRNTIFCTTDTTCIKMTNFILKDNGEDLFYDDNGNGSSNADTFSQPPAVETMQTTKQNSSAFQGLMPLVQSVTPLANDNMEAKLLLCSELKEAEIEIHQVIANK